MTTNVPAPTFGPTGFVSPPQSAILAGVFADLNAAFNGNLNPALETAQGQITSSLTAIIGNTDDTFVFFTNMVDPAFSTGRMQDAIARIYFLERNPAQPTVVQALCTGAVGVAIPAGALAQATDGNIYSCTTGGLIGAGGTVTLPFACTVTGPIACPENTLTTIYQAIPGWDSITNPSDGVLGNDVESRAAFEARRAASVAGNSFGAIGSIIGAVAKVQNVLDFYGYDNATSSPVTITGVTIAANSIYICVEGGTDAAVAQAIWSKKSAGCAYTGNTTVTVYDTNPLYSAPVPYSVTFERPASLSVLFAVNIANGPQVPSNAVALIQNAIISAFSGADGGTRARIGSKIYASRFIAPIAALGAWVQLISLQIGSNNTPSAHFTAAISGTNMTVSAVASGALAAGQTISDITGALIEGTTIISQSSGSPGSTGVYVISATQTVSSEAMVSSIADLNTVQVNINQVPTVEAANIIVTVT